MRATVAPGADGRLRCNAAPDQDSSLVATFARANALVVRPPSAPAAQADTPVPVILLE
jgi:molybdopterin molybdotransferase